MGEGRKLMPWQQLIHFRSDKDHAHVEPWMMERT